MRADGTRRAPLDVRSARGRPSSCVDAGGVTSIAVVFLHAYANPRHEAEAARLVARRHPEIAVTTSHEVAPEIREYERASTTVANAYIKPLAAPVSRRHGPTRVAGLGIPAPLLLMLSSGGLTHVAEAERAPVQMLESGPAAGALAAAFFGARGQRRRPARLRHGRHHRQALRWSTAASRSPRTASRRRARSASSKAAACRSASRPSS